MGLLFKSTVVVAFLFLLLLVLVLVAPAWTRSFVHVLADTYSVFADVIWKSKQRKAQMDILEEEKLNRQVWSPPAGRGVGSRSDVDAQ